MSKSGTYLIKEIFGPTLQGEGIHAGRPCVFLRFAVCNLACSWCDTDFSPHGAKRLSCEQIVSRLLEVDCGQSRLVIVTGGEPTLQWDPPLADALRGAGFTVHMESNGTHAPAAPVDWLTISPKPQFHPTTGAIALAAASPSEVKLVVDDSFEPSTLAALRDRYPSCEHWLLQPCMDDDYTAHLAHVLALLEQHPAWRLSLQLHKILDVP